MKGAQVNIYRIACQVTVALAIAAPGLVAQRTVPLTLEMIVGDAGTIVHCRVAGTETGRDPVSGLLVTWVTVDVRENFYGAPGMRFTFKQYGGEADGIVFRPADLPSYAKGEEMVLMLYPPAKTTGMQSPVGLGQGKFVVKATGNDGRKSVTQAVSTGALLKGMQNTRIKRGAGETMDFDSFTGTVRTLVRQVKN
ncbi:MAG: hypothetical protein A2X67_02425 [Ignavibacteria bacterium GWA2_55_11]|nr:MAG: hypothetical protein A2X67_02425 [Ignavibacteria bacterium GWA2_55_11]OGU43297.1 MAG: hypothetical protein A2X68_13030 [Ignavibacteria bacterium GWC2_56_12]OGU73959.1 MAG: hypothetical protein A3H45_14995 [Ignavibacteria bacterium RIFCSPLOWO2_02_FULL_55_14]OGU76175.1 MAG: hypothetical protein A3G43_12375 [Ignavibacteria bacterium RIFCSPLOWO2_12_FULL_56_21]HAV23406.1 hypothetical protein [Bacteroidota bacterium]